MALAVVDRGQNFIRERDPAWTPGRHLLTLTVHDVSYQDAGGLWLPTQEVLVADGLDGFVDQCATMRHRIRVGGTGQRRWYPRVNVPGEYVDSGAPDYWRTSGGGAWRPWQLTGLTKLANGYRWETADYRVELTFNWHRVKLLYTLKTANAPLQVRFPLSFTGLTYDQASGEIRSGSTVAGWLDPVHVTTEGSPAKASGVYSGGYYTITITPNGAAYPFTVDPTFTDGSGQVVNSASDTYIAQNSATYNYGVSTGGSAGCGTSASTIKNRPLIYFDPSSIPGGSTINTAVVGLYFYSQGDTNTRAVSIHRALTQWYEGNKDGAAPSGGVAGSIWNYRNAIGNVAWAGGAGGAANSDWATAATSSLNITNASYGYKEWDVKADVEAFLGGTATNYGWWLIGDEANNNSRKTFYFSDNASNRPYLTVDYTAGGGGVVIPVVIQHRRQQGMA